MIWKSILFLFYFITIITGGGLDIPLADARNACDGGDHHHDHHPNKQALPPNPTPSLMPRLESWHETTLPPGTRYGESQLGQSKGIPLIP